MTVGELLAEARARLQRAPSASSPREATLLLGFLLGRHEAWVIAHDDDPVPVALCDRLLDLAHRRAGGEPIAYLVGEREFYGRGFAVDNRVLIPRPETEHLVDAALAHLDDHAARILDLGTGSGCIAVTLACELPAARITGVDRSLEALSVARANATRHGVTDRLHLVAADWATALRLDRFDLVVSNPPYVDEDDPSTFDPMVRAFEPHGALFAPEQGLGDLGRLLSIAGRMRSGTRLIVEIGYRQLDAVKERSAVYGWQLEEVVEDLAGIPRTVVLATP